MQALIDIETLRSVHAPRKDWCLAIDGPSQSWHSLAVAISSMLSISLFGMRGKLEPRKIFRTCAYLRLSSGDEFFSLHRRILEIIE
jgi:hypothetical protein